MSARSVPGTSLASTITSLGSSLSQAWVTATRPEMSALSSADLESWPRSDLAELGGTLQLSSWS